MNVLKLNPFNLFTNKDQCVTNDLREKALCFLLFTPSSMSASSMSDTLLSLISIKYLSAKFQFSKIQGYRLPSFFIVVIREH